MPEQILYVVLHGLIPVVEDDEGFHAILIQMDEHEVLAGHWLTEISLDVDPGSILELRGVSPGEASIPANLNLVLNRKVDLDRITASRDCLARIDMPKPFKCFSLVTGDASGMLTGSDQPTFQKYSCVQVFQYIVPGPDFTQTGIFEDDEAVWQVRGSTLMEFTNYDRISVLHVYNEPGEATPPLHSREEFLKGSELFGLDLGLIGDDNTCLKFPGLQGTPQASLPEGLLVSELAPLSVRETKVFEILDPLRAGGGQKPGDPVGGGHYCGYIYIGPSGS